MIWAEESSSSKVGDLTADRICTLVKISKNYNLYRNVVARFSAKNSYQIILLIMEETDERKKLINEIKENNPNYYNLVREADQILRKEIKENENGIKENYNSPVYGN